MAEQNKLVVYVGPFGFPKGGAAAKRIYGNCVTLSQQGYEVKVVSGQVPPDGIVESNYKNIPVISLNERLYEKLPRFLKHFLYFSAGKKAVQWLDSLDKKPRAIILYSGYSPYLLRLIPWAKKNNVKLIFDTVEWYDPPSLISRFFSPYYLNIELAMRFLLKKCDGLIVISSYLENYYKEKVKDLVVIPPTVDCSQIESRIALHECDTVKFVYAGSPGKKDALSSIISAIISVASSGYRVQLNIAGVTEKNLKDYIPNVKIDNLGEIIKCYGLVSAESAADLVKDSDFSIIIRPDIRSVQAGFPTKFVESLSVGTPVIANLTSDLGVYLKHGINGYICKDDSIESLVDVLISSINNNDLYTMRINARETAEKYFDVSVYSAHMKRIIES